MQAQAAESFGFARFLRASGVQKLEIVRHEVEIPRIY
jgi:hypothetical protein